MTPLKFRAWHKKEKLMFEPDLIGNEGRFVDFKHERGLDRYQKNQLEIMQSTGLFDRNGKEIFEGDIIHFKDYDIDPNHRRKDHDKVDEGIAQVVFGHTVAGGEVGYTHGWWMRIIDNPKYKPFGFARGMEQEMEIIGNIHENPELLSQ